jgi:hypothetical protein
MEIIEVDGLHIAYERTGGGPSLLLLLLLLLHGYVGDGPTTWRRQIEALRRIHGGGLGRTRGRSIIRSAGIVWHRRLRRLPGRIP